MTVNEQMGILLQLLNGNFDRDSLIIHPNAKEVDIKSFWEIFDSFQSKLKYNRHSKKICKKKKDPKVKKTKENCPYCSKDYRSNQIKKHKKQCLQESEKCQKCKQWFPKGNKFQHQVDMHSYEDCLKCLEFYEVWELPEHCKICEETCDKF